MIDFLSRNQFLQTKNQVNEKAQKKLSTRKKMLTKKVSVKKTCKTFQCLFEKFVQNMENFYGSKDSKAHLK